jgi:hypothetical protein
VHGEVYGMRFLFLCASHANGSPKTEAIKIAIFFISFCCLNFCFIYFQLFMAFNFVSVSRECKKSMKNHKHEHAGGREKVSYIMFFSNIHHGKNYSTFFFWQTSRLTSNI